MSQKNILLYFGFIAVSFMIGEFTGKSPIKFIIFITLSILVYKGAFDLPNISDDDEEE
jgi:hypothetical protein